MYFPLNDTKMQTVIFYPSEWNGHICMRIELYGCVPGISYILLPIRHLHLHVLLDNSFNNNVETLTSFELVGVIIV